MQSRSFIRALKATIRAGIVALSTVSVANAGSFGSVPTFHTSCLAHDLGLEYIPGAPKFNSELLGLNEDVAVSTALPDDEIVECVRSSQKLDMERAISASMNYIDEKIRLGVQKGIELTMWYSRWHDAWRSRIEGSSVTIAELLASAQSGDDEMDVVSERNSIVEDNLSISSDSSKICEWNGCEWDCEQQIAAANHPFVVERQFGILPTGKPANVFVFTFHADSVAAPASNAIALQGGMDPVCEEVQESSAIVDWRALYHPDVCILAPDLLETPKLAAPSVTAYSVASSPSDRIVAEPMPAQAPEIANAQAEIPPVLEQPSEWIASESTYGPSISDMEPISEMESISDIEKIASPNVIAERIAQSISPNNWHELNTTAWAQQLQVSRNYTRWLDDFAIHTVRSLEIGGNHIEVISQPESQFAEEQPSEFGLGFDETGIPIPMEAASDVNEAANAVDLAIPMEQLRLQSSRQLARGLKLVGSTLLRWSSDIEKNVRMAEGMAADDQAHLTKQ